MMPGAVQEPNDDRNEDLADFTEREVARLRALKDFYRRGVFKDDDPKVADLSADSDRDQ